MHILLLPSWYPETPDSLDGLFFRQQAHALARAGLRVGVAAPLFRSPRRWREIFAGRYGNKLFSDGPIATYTRHSSYFCPPLPHFDRERWLAAGMRLFARYLAEQGRPDLLHAHAVSHGGILARRIARRYGIPYVITEHSSTYARGLVRRWQRPAMIAAAAGAAARLAVSPAFCRLLANEYPGLDWQYLPNILPPAFAAPLPMTERPSENRENGSFVFCSAAHLNRNKGFDILLEAFALALKQQPGLRLEIAGGGAELANLQRQAGRLNIARAVRFHGAVSAAEMPQFMRRSDAFVLASRSETFGMVFVEALSQGLPVAATRCGGPESIIGADNGLLVPPDNPAALADAMLHLRNCRSRYRSASIRANCLAQYGETAVTGRLKDVYRAVLRQTQSGGA
ncbi:Mannosylfructose-phosphate synthase [Kingella potus]|uniref:Mannosylfructose-phosphate synthase n=1 Tax=Kingella potus TaxID=265175 RepID=A0A377R4Q2_9NEIS|nr:glycosyltransferase [Kingella potus]UOP00408.1 glycosyltransferase [Kingella potus]STR02525.1 Mannosylfructose-phosphate synthase [Kingella potus]